MDTDTLTECIETVATAEQRFARADAAAEAADSELHDARLALNAAKRDLRDAQREAIEEAKEQGDT